MKLNDDDDETRGPEGSAGFSFFAGDHPEDEWIKLEALALMLPAGRGGKKCQTHTVKRWIERGVPDRRNRCVARLRAVMMGGTWYTSKKAFNEFVAATTKAALDGVKLK